jgi:5-methylcytosine-specific restriction endonuclease McrA
MSLSPERLEYFRKYREQHREQIRKSHRESAKRCRDADLDAARNRARIYCAENIEHRRELGRKHDAKRREKRREDPVASNAHAIYQKAYRERNPDKIRSLTEKWRSTNADKVRVWSKVSNNRRRQAPGSWTAQDIQRMWEQQAGHCWWRVTASCKKRRYRLSMEFTHVDHRIPLILGGTNELENLVLSCADCNLSKSAKLPGEFSGRLL